LPEPHSELIANRPPVVQRIEVGQTASLGFAPVVAMAAESRGRMMRIPRMKRIAWQKELAQPPAE
jgi:hypothetical protein